MKNEILHIKSIREHHKILGYKNLRHPLISIMRFEDFPPFNIPQKIKFTLGFYTITLKKNYDCKSLYGQTVYDFDEGLMGFTAPDQISGLDENFKKPSSGWLLLIHPDFVRGYPLAQKIKASDYFQYAVNEALILSEDEERSIDELFKNIEKEYHLPIDTFSQDILILQIDLLLTLCNRFYQRQFVTRKVINSDLLTTFEIALNEYFNNETQLHTGLPTVTYFADRLNLSSKYLSDLLKNLTGHTTQQHIHKKLIEKAKEKLSATTLTISEIAYELGFEHSQSFSKLFKSKTNQSPIEFRQLFN